MLGSLASSATRFSRSLELYTSGAGPPGLEGKLHAACERTKQVLLVLLGAGLGLVHGGEDEIFEQLGVAALHGFRLDLQANQALPAVHGRLDRAPAGAGLEAGALQLFVDLPHLRLELLGLLHHLANVLP